MNTSGRLAAYGAGLVAVFVAALALAAVIVPDREATESAAPAPHGAHGDGENTDDASTSGKSSDAAGLSLSQDGYTLSALTAPTQVGDRGAIGFAIQNAAGDAVTDFETSHERELHLLVVRTDGSHFTHLHPTLDAATGIWSAPWQWSQPGTYRVYADATPSGSQQLTLSRTVDVAGEVAPRPATEIRTADSVDGFDVNLTGALTPGDAGTITATITRGAQPVTELQPYLGAFGHLVALRDGDLAYLHVHAEGDTPTPNATAGPHISFSAHAPTAGRYLLYLDFQVDGQVHTATFVLDAAGPESTESTPADSESGNHKGGHG